MRLPRVLRLALLPAAIAWLVAGRSFAASPAGGAGNPPARNVTIVRSAAEAKAALEKHLPSTGGRLAVMTARACIADLCLPLHREKLVRDVRVIVPSRNPLKPADMEGIRRMLAEEGISSADIGTFSMDNGCVSGTAGGLPVRLYPLPEIPRDLEPSVLFLDSAFFLPLYQDEVRTPMVDLVAGEIAKLLNAGGRIASVVLLDSAAEPDFPLEQGGVTHLLKMLLASPEPPGPGLSGRLAIRKDADLLYFFMRYPEALGAYKRWSVLEPEDASACFRIAIMAMNDLDPGMALQWLNKSAAIDPAYKRGYPELANFAERKKAYDVAERFLRAGVTAFPRDPAMATILAMYYVSRGNALLDAGEPEAAAGAFRNGSRVEGADEEVLRAAAKRLEGLAGDSVRGRRGEGAANETE